MSHLFPKIKRRISVPLPAEKSRRKSSARVRPNSEESSLQEKCKNLILENQALLRANFEMSKKLEEAERKKEQIFQQLAALSQLTQGQEKNLECPTWSQDGEKNEGNSQKSTENERQNDEDILSQILLELNGQVYGDCAETP